MTMTMTMSERLKKLADRLAILAVAIALAGAVLHFTLRDSWQWLAPFFYALPLPVIAVTLFGAGTWWQWRLRAQHTPPPWGRNAVKSCFAAGGLVFLAWWGISWSRSDKESPEGGTVRIAFWNAAGREGAHPMVPLLEWLQHSKVEVLAMVEVGGLSAEVRRNYRDALPGYEVYRLGNGMALFCRGSARELRRIEMANRSSAHLVEWVLEGHDGGEELTLQLVVADIGPNPFFARGDLLEGVLQLAGGEAAGGGEPLKPTVIVGDFNTPYESAHFDAYRQHFQHAWTESGSGYRETWPWFFPVLCIDHLWLSRQLSAVKTERKNFFQSDHSMIVTLVTWGLPVAEE